VIKNPESALNEKSPPGQTAAGFIYQWSVSSLGNWMGFFVEMQEISFFL